MSNGFVGGIIFGITVGIMYIFCCALSVKKAIKDRRRIIEKNFKLRNEKYLHEMGFDKKDITTLFNNEYHSKNPDQILNKFPPNNGITPDSHLSTNPLINTPLDNDLQNKSGTGIEKSRIRKIQNLEDIDEVLNETLTNTETVTDSLSVEGQLSPSGTFGEIVTVQADVTGEKEFPEEAMKDENDNTKSNTYNQSNNNSTHDYTITHSQFTHRHHQIGPMAPKIKYLKAKNSSSNADSQQHSTLHTRNAKTNSMPNPKSTNWITERLEEAQRQLDYGFKKAPIAKQNSGFSSMDEESSSSFV